MTPEEFMAAFDEGRRKAQEARRAMTHCGRGHALSGKNLYQKPGGKRQCRACLRIKDKERRDSKVEEMRANKEHPLHGKPIGYRQGCRCFRCRLAYHFYRKRELGYSETVDV